MQEMQETPLWSLGWEDHLKEEMATHSHIFARKIPWTEEPGELQSMGSQKSRTWLSYWVHIHTHTHTHTHTQCFIMPRTHNYPYICEALGKNWSSILRNIKMTNMHLRRLKKWSHDHESLTWHASLMYTIELNINDLFLMYHNLWNA